MPSGGELTRRANQLIKRAEYTRSDASKIAHIMCDLMGTDFYNPNNCLIATKSPERTVEKAYNDYQGHIESVTDGCRLMLPFDDPAAINRVRRYILPGKHGNQSEFERYLKGTKFEFHGQPKDMFETPKKWGYMGFLLKFHPTTKHRSYTPFEVQITHRGMLEDYYPHTHDLYESRRVQIENYMQDGIPVDQWDRDTLRTVRSMLAHHEEGALHYGLRPYVKNWPNIFDDERIMRPEDDIAEDDYTSLSAPDTSQHHQWEPPEA